MKFVQTKCEFCGSTFTPKRAGHKICSIGCHTARTNIRRLRCDQVYDLLMQRAESYRNRGLITEIDRLCRAWRDEDRAAGRKTWSV